MKLLEPNLKSIQLFWRAANYLSVGMLYLKNNPLLREELSLHHFKQGILGHWGACPGVNAIYAHASDLSRRSGQQIRLIVGSGHAGPAILSNLFLEGSLEKVYPEYKRNIEGMANLFNAFASNNGFNTEITPHYPGMLYSGGELGAALAFSQGYALNNPKSFSVCIIGDGELETSIAHASWQGFKFLSSNDGKILPVINANGYKMGSKSLYSLKSRIEHEQLFNSYGLIPMFIGDNHQQIAEAFNLAYLNLISSKTLLQPIIILESPKGWTAPEKFGTRLFEGSCNSHKPILKNPSKDTCELEMVKNWLLSYVPNELFDDDGSPFEEVTQCLPSSKNLFGFNHKANKGHKTLLKETIYNTESPIDTIIKDLINRMKESKDIIVFSPDELASNKFDKILEITKLKYCNLNDLVYSTHGNVIEILNEHLCYAWSQGFSMAGNHAVLISYEAFAPIFESLTAQHLKFLKILKKLKWQPSYPSVNIILTSLGWNNSSTHHNPGFVDNFIGRNQSHVKIYMPVTAKAAAIFFNEMMESYNQINIMVINKNKLEKISSLSNFIKEDSCKSWRVLQSDMLGDLKITIIAIGDIMAEESLCAKDILNSYYPEIFVRVVVIEDLSLLENSTHLEIEKFKSIITDSSGCVWAYNGYPKTIKGLLWDIGIIANTKVLGYLDYDQTNAGFERLSINAVSRYDIANEAIRLVLSNQNAISFESKINFCIKSKNHD
ncbi:MAG: hypothetical protein KKG99_11230 [Bacteroidetes bacterium]|nr:hypothetical protein [Bacteroidota bacterium]